MVECLAVNTILPPESRREGKKVLAKIQDNSLTKMNDVK